MHVLMTGPLRPSIDYVIWFCNDIRQRIPDCKVYILYWETTDEDRTRLEGVFDKVFAVPEPLDSNIVKLVTARTKHQKSMNGASEFLTLSNYRMFYGVRSLIDRVDLADSETVMRIRTDNYVVKMDTIHTPKENEFLFCPKILCGNACDWFGISSLGTLKKLYYITDGEYNHMVANAWNSEHMIMNNATTYGVETVSVNATTRLAIARE